MVRFPDALVEDLCHYLYCASLDPMYFHHYVKPTVAYLQKELQQILGKTLCFPFTETPITAECFQEIVKKLRDEIDSLYLASKGSNQPGMPSCTDHLD